jgi:hypothetical protein
MEANNAVSQQIDLEYGAICSKIGELYIQATELRKQLRTLHEQIDTLTVQRATIAARYHQAVVLEQKAAPAADVRELRGK